MISIVCSNQDRVLETGGRLTNFTGRTLGDGRLLGVFLCVPKL